MKIWKISIVLLLFSYYKLEGMAQRSPETAHPVTLQLPDATPQAISNAEQEIKSLKQELLNLENKNDELIKLKKLKKELNTRIDTLHKTYQQQLQQNNPLYLEMQAAIDKKKIDPELKKKTMRARQAIKIDHKQLEDLQKNVHNIKTKIQRIEPKRKNKLQMLHAVQKHLKELELAAQITKIKDRPL